jgi:ribosomal protein L24E
MDTRPVGSIAEMPACECGCGGRVRPIQATDKSRGRMKGRPNRFLLGHHIRVNHPTWKGGRNIDHNGYVEVHSPDSPRAGRVHGVYVFEHILVVERALGHTLRVDAPVHHVDRDKQNNANTNLVACDSAAYHRLLHKRQSALDACGDPSAIRCAFCSGYEGQGAMVLRKDGSGFHRACRLLWERNHRRLKKNLVPVNVEPSHA